MSRPPNEKTQEAELLRFNLVFSLDELAITRIRFQQAMRRDPTLKELCTEGIEEIDRVTKWMREIVVNGSVK